MEHSVVYLVPDLTPWALSQDDPDGLTYEKEVIYEGDFVKKNEKGEVVQEFSVFPGTISHWKSEMDRMLQNGVKIPWPIEHTTDPEKTRANSLSSRIGRNAKGKLALYVKSKFRDAEAAKLAASSDVSIFVVPEASDGNGNTYYRPIRHIAFTNYPVIPGLEEFRAIAASLVSGDSNMASALLPLAQKLGVPNAETLDDVAIEAQIMSVFQTMKGELDQLKGDGAPADPNADPANPANPAQPPGPPKVPAVGGPKQPVIPKAMAASFTRILKDNRTGKLDDLVRNGNITKATRDELAKQYINDDVLALSLSDETNEGDFDNLIAALRNNKAVEYNPKTGRQISGAMALSNPGSMKAEDNALMRDVERRRAEATRN